VLRATAPWWQLVGTTGYVFSSWSSGSGNPLVVASPPSATTFTAAYQPSVDQEHSAFFTLAPCRLLDTRDPDGPLGGPVMSAGASRVFDVRGTCGIPATATAITVNVTATGATGPGHFRFWATDETMPVSSTVNFTAGVTRANNAVLRLGASGRFSAFCSMPAGTAHLVVDVAGYFE
jgi:hypothetical protein